MTDSALAQAYAMAHALSSDVRRHWDDTTDPADRAEAANAMRQANSLAVVIEKWIAARSMRAATGK